MKKTIWELHVKFLVVQTTTHNLVHLRKYSQLNMFSNAGILGLNIKGCIN
ncbi:hypothetical protein [Flavobacterium johnsoniae]|nr:hypothetical protein [Flavobacterium johnsoniae]